MPRGDKSKYTDKQKRQAEHIEEGYKARGVSDKEAEARAWATVNATDHGGKKSGSGRGKARNPGPAKKGGAKGGAASANRSAEARSQSAKKAAATRKRNKAAASPWENDPKRWKDGRMSLALKPLNEQVMVITGASSGIGLVTARMASRRGAQLVLVARNEAALRQLADELNQSSANHAIYVVADVGEEAAHDAIVRRAVQHFGRIDTWINNAGVGLYGELLVTPTADNRKLFETNFWGVVYGSLAAARHLRTRDDGSGGAIVNIGSEVSDRAVILIGMYSASKHAVKGFTEALRMELEADGVPVTVTLVKPSATDTPFPNHAQNLLDQEPTLPEPVYDPVLVAEAILYAAQTPVRDIYPTGAGLKTAIQGALMPRLTNWFMERNNLDKQHSRHQPVRNDDALHGPTTGLNERGLPHRSIRQFSDYGLTRRHPYLLSAVAIGMAIVATDWALGASRTIV